MVVVLRCVCIISRDMAGANARSMDTADEVNVGATGIRWRERRALARMTDLEATARMVHDMRSIALASALQRERGIEDEGVTQQALAAMRAVATGGVVK